MSSKIQYCVREKLITPPNWLPDNMQYETIMGSVAYGCSSDTSDMDIYGFCIPPKSMVFPHTAGYIQDFDSAPKFEQYQQHHIEDKAGRRNFDFTIYGIVRYFRLLMDNNPNIVDSIFTPADCVQHITNIGQMVKDNRKLFLHKGSYVKLKAYAYSQLHKMSSKEREGKRKELYDQYGFDIKFAYHLLRLLNECEQILIHGDLDLRQNREQLKACRRGEIPEEEIRAIFTEKEKYLESLLEKSPLPETPPEAKIKKLLLECLESHYGNLSAVIEKPDITKTALREIIKLAENAL